MQFNSLEELYDYLATYTVTEIMESDPLSFDMNAKATQMLFRNAINTQKLDIAFDVLAYANEHSIQLVKGN